jgi:beta-N-acetylhexosaminidase
MATPRAVVFGCAGPTLTARERALFRDADPWGFIVFARNVDDPAQLAALTAALRDSVGRDAPILVDQEGGRVARLRGPHWRDWPDVGVWLEGLAPEARPDAVRRRYRVIGAELRAVGIDVNCAPLLDLRLPVTHPFLRDRAMAADPAEAGALGRAVRDGLADAGVAAVVKHVPGHGRAEADSHAALPVVDADAARLRADFAPFAANADAPMAMTAHVRFTALDDARCATFSPTVIAQTIRGAIGFDGLLMTDDLNMGALDGRISERAARALVAGCDIALHCSGDLAEMEAVADATPRLAGRSLARAQAAAIRPTPRLDLDVADDLRILRALDREMADA